MASKIKMEIDEVFVNPCSTCAYMQTVSIISTYRNKRVVIAADCVMETDKEFTTSFYNVENIRVLNNMDVKLTKAMEAAAMTAIRLLKLEKGHKAFK